MPDPTGSTRVANRMVTVMVRMSCGVCHACKWIVRTNSIVPAVETPVEVAGRGQVAEEEVAGADCSIAAVGPGSFQGFAAVAR